MGRDKVQALKIKSHAPVKWSMAVEGSTLADYV
jgi:hypothetical protein